MQWEVLPFAGLGPLTFGSKRASIRAMLGEEFTSFLKHKQLPPIDVYNGLGLHLYYDEQGELEFIETFPPCDPRYRGVKLLDDLGTVLRNMSELGFPGQPDDVGYSFDELGFGLYAPLGEIEGVSIYRRGYYEKYS